MVGTISREARHVFRVAEVVQAVMGLTMGLYIYTFGPLFYEKLASMVDAKTAITFTTILFVIDSLLGAALEVPTGAIGDSIGRKRTVIWSLFFRTFYFIFLAFVPFSQSLMLTVLIGSISLFAFRLGYTFFSGSFSAWCVDKLREVAPEIGCELILSKGYTYNFVALLVGGVAGVVCYLHKIPHYGFVFAALLTVFCMVFCIGEMEDEKNLNFLPANQISFAMVSQRVGQILGLGFQVFRESRIILAVVWIYAAYMCCLNVVDYLWPVYLRSKTPPDMQSEYWIGLVVVSMGACAIAARGFQFATSRLANHADRQKSFRVQEYLYLGSCLFTALPLIWLSRLTALQHDTFWTFVAAVLPVQFGYGIVAPCFETLINENIPEKHSQERATILSFGSLVRSLFLIFLAVPSGGSSGATTTTGWAIPAAFLVISTLYGAYVLLLSTES